MAGATEHEILDCMRSNLLAAAAHADGLALVPKQGPNFEAFRAELSTVESCCRQMAGFREDTRWLPLCLLIEEAHQRARRWIVGHSSRELFLKLADNLRSLALTCDRLGTASTGRAGMILPDAPRDDRANRPVAVRRPSGLIVPKRLASV